MGLIPICVLFRGSARDPLRRWSAAQVRSWLAREVVDAPEEVGAGEGQVSGPSIRLGDRSFTNPKSFALAAAEAANWDLARDLTLRGAVATWLDERMTDPKVIARVRRLSADKSQRRSPSYPRSDGAQSVPASDGDGGNPDPRVAPGASSRGL